MLDRFKNFMSNILFFILSPLIFPFHFILSLCVSKKFREMFLGGSNIYMLTFYGEEYKDE